MSGSYFCADPHFTHGNIITFKTGDNKPLRDFTSVEEMDECMVYNWNCTVKPRDTTYILGDVVINRRALPILDRLNGRKVLVKGNHDIFPLKDYVKYFDDIRAYKVMTKEGIICSHIPIHPDSLSRWRLNLHGHLHSNKVEVHHTYSGMSSHGIFEPDKRYRCISMEQINYTPISLEQIVADMKKDSAN